LKPVLQCPVLLSCPFTRRAGDIPDNLDWGVFRSMALVFLLDGGEGTHEQAGDVGQDGGATRGDTAFGEKSKEIGERAIDALGGVEGVASDGEEGAQIVGGVLLGVVIVAAGSIRARYPVLLSRVMARAK
jgi:hypothetical protein